MEQLYLNLAEHEFSKGRKILLWIFCTFFLLVGIGIIYMNIIQHQIKIHISFSIVPFGIAIFTGIIAYLSTVKRENHYFLVNDEKIEYRYGLLKPIKRTFKWENLKEVHLAHKQKKFRLVYNEKNKPLINITWLEKKKSYLIIRHIYFYARAKNITVKKFNYL